MKNIKILFLSICLILPVQMIHLFPWWSFVIPLFILGLFIQHKKWNVNSFMIGFLAGFIIWFGATLYFDTKNNSLILDKIGVLLSLNKILIMILSGCIGGLLAGVSLLTGTKFFEERTEKNIEKFIQNNKTNY